MTARIVAPVVMGIVMLALWEAVVRVAAIPPYVLPGPLLVARTLIDDWGMLAPALVVTLTITLQALAAAVVVGVLLAVLFSLSRWIELSLFPYAIILQVTPIVAIAPLILMWFGSGLRSVMLVAFVICLFPIIANTTQGLISVPRNLIDLFVMSNASRSRLLLKLRLPYALPHLFVGLRISAGISVIGAVTGELFASSNAVGEGGLGYSITYANSQLQTDYLFALVLTASLLGFLFFFTVFAFSSNTRIYIHFDTIRTKRSRHR